MKLLVATTEDELPSVHNMLEHVVREIYLYWDGELALNQLLASLIMAGMAVTEAIEAESERADRLPLPLPVEALARAMAHLSRCPEFKMYAERLRSAVRMLVGYHADQILEEG